MENPYFPELKSAPIKTALYTPIVPFGWTAVSQWLNPQTLKKDVKKSQNKTIKKSFTISSKSAKKVAVAEPVPVKNSVSLPFFFKISLVCTAILVAVFFFVKKSK